MPSLEAKHILSTEPLPQPIAKRNLGGAIILEAIRSYRSTDSTEHREAVELLYPSTTGAWLYWDWVVSVAAPMDPKWLRQNLDDMRPRWDAERKRKVDRMERRRA